MRALACALCCWPARAGAAKQRGFLAEIQGCLHVDPTAGRYVRRAHAQLAFHRHIMDNYNDKGELMNMGKKVCVSVLQHSFWASL